MNKIYNVTSYVIAILMFPCLMLGDKPLLFLAPISYGVGKLFISFSNNPNITFSGGFDLEETPKYLNEIDILNNLFGNKNIALDTALSIRMYYALFLNKPIITTDDTFTATEANKFGLGFSVNPENLKGIGDELMDWYNNLNVMDINHKREAYRNDVIENNKQFYQEIGRIFNE
ncbi:capsular polysaccharide synthesis enzyme [Staphylococcus aureus]|nr:capsular polysaccharide synthesis enzyme [Staphylococcus aureus]